MYKHNRRMRLSFSIVDSSFLLCLFLSFHSLIISPRISNILLTAPVSMIPNTKLTQQRMMHNALYLLTANEDIKQNETTTINKQRTTTTVGESENYENADGLFTSFVSFSSFQQLLMKFSFDLEPFPLASLDIYFNRQMYKSSLHSTHNCTCC